MSHSNFIQIVALPAISDVDIRGGCRSQPGRQELVPQAGSPPRGVCGYATPVIFFMVKFYTSFHYSWGCSSATFVFIILKQHAPVPESGGRVDYLGGGDQIGWTNFYEL